MKDKDDDCVNITWNSNNQEASARKMNQKKMDLEI